MPGRNGTGPLGMGPMTGRGFGPCRTGRFVGRPRLGLRYGYGRGLNRYNCYGSYSVDESTERSFLEDEKTMLETRLKDINKMLDESQNKEE